MKRIAYFLKPLSVFLGTVIGVGIFGLPFIASRIGFIPTLFYFLFILLIAGIAHFLFADVVVGTKKFYRLPGYVGEYLGEKAKKIAFAIISTGILGALLAYLVIGGRFLNAFFSYYFKSNSLFSTLLFFVLGSYFVLRGIKSISWAELFLLFVFLVIVFMLFIKLFPLFDYDYYKTVDLSYAVFPFGVLLFSLWGSAIVPEVKEMMSLPDLKEKILKRNLKLVIAIGLVLSVLVYIFFIFVVLGISGPKTTEDAFSGIAGILGDNSYLLQLAFILGTICCFTSYITLGLTLKKVFWYDFGIQKNLSFFLASLLPLIFFILGIQEFIKIIGFTGAIAIGSEGIMIVFLKDAFLKKKENRRMSKLYYLLVFIFVFGIISEVIYLLQ